MADATVATQSTGLNVWKAVKPYVLGGVSGMFATSVIQPIDLVKVRLQLEGEGGKGAKSSPMTVFRNVVKNEGFGTLYTGLGAAWLRQATYTTARLGMFNQFMDMIKARKEKGQPVTFAERGIAGLVAGGLGALVGTPADLALIRLQADGTLPPEQRRNYTGVGNALSRIVKEEGVLGLWKGAAPTVVRAMALNFGMLAFNDQAKETLEKRFGAGLPATLGASAIAGFFASFFSLPFDFVKTRMQKQRPDANGVLPYKSPIDCAVKVLKAEGPLAFYRGFATYYVRIAPHVMITLVTLDYLNKKTKSMGL